MNPYNTNTYQMLWFRSGMWLSVCLFGVTVAIMEGRYLPASLFGLLFVGFVIQFLLFRFTKFGQKDKRPKEDSRDKVEN